jgi:hypothetical protein
MSTLRTATTMAQCSAILAALQAGRSLTPSQALRDFRCFRLAARIYDLRKSGHSIATTWEHGERKRWARYVLLKSASRRTAN